MIDLDNTLVDRAGAVDAWAGAFSALHELPADAARWIVETDNDGYSDRRVVFQAIRGRFGLDDSIEDLLVSYRRRVVELARLCAGANECLTALRSAGWSIVIVTNGSTGQQNSKIEALGLRDLVDGVCISEELGITKPDERIFRAAAALVDEQLEHAWMVGDSPLLDIVGAARLGVRTAWIRRGRTWSSELAKPDAVLDSLVDLAGVIAGK
jgi:putative hydrolase of the HAD superfamily